LLEQNGYVSGFGFVKEAINGALWTNLSHRRRSWRRKVREKKYLAVFAICIIGVVGALGWYQSLSGQHGGWTTYWVEYSLTKNGNHTQIRSSYNNGVVNTEQAYWLNFDNRTAVYNYFGCTPSMPGCTLDGCPFTVLNDSVSEYRVRVVCKPGG
jgi:hypothetical protein